MKHTLHTPGPMASYTLIISTDSGYEGETKGRCNAVQHSIAMAALHGNTPDSLSLISAAPALLEALKDMLDGHEDACTGYGEGAADKARAAIAKATGEQP